MYNNFRRAILRIVLLKLERGIATDALAIWLSATCLDRLIIILALWSWGELVDRMSQLFVGVIDLS